jgi:hypothetical protein
VNVVEVVVVLVNVVVVLVAMVEVVVTVVHVVSQKICQPVNEQQAAFAPYPVSPKSNWYCFLSDPAMSCISPLTCRFKDMSRPFK